MTGEIGTQTGQFHKIFKSSITIKESHQQVVIRSRKMLIQIFIEKPL